MTAQTNDDGPVAGPPPAVGDLLAVPPDDWAWLLPHLRASLDALDETVVDARVKRLRSSPASRLAGGRVRRELCELIAAGGPVWWDLATRLDELILPEPLGFLTGRPVAPGPNAPTDADPDQAPPRPAEATEADRRLRERARKLKEQRDEARRRAAGAESRAELLSSQLDELRSELDGLRGERDGLEAQLAESRREVGRVAERERRRRDARVEELEAELREIRRRQEQEREERARRRREKEAEEVNAARARESKERRRGEPKQRLIPGRPTRLPRGVVPDTTQEVDLLLGPGRLLIVDGYNVTITHRSNLSLEEQRVWLVRHLATLAASRKVRPEVIFDGRDLGVTPRRIDGSRGVVVRFSLEGVTADEEIELAVSATDEPIVVVTDDRELRDRLRPHGVDLVRTTPFLSVSS